MMGPMMGPPPREAAEKLKEPKPKSLREVPGYVYRVTRGFFYRLFYIFGLVWETGPWILFLMVFMAIFNGVIPVIGSLISASLVNGLVEAYNSAVSGGENLFSMVMGLLLLQFGFIFFRSFVSSISSILNRIAGETVVNHVKIKIMNKAKTIDLSSFDRPEFYEKLENASHEAGNRPIQIMNATFSIVSTIISMASFIVMLAAVSPVAPLIIILMSVPSAIINFVYRKKNFLYMRMRSKDRRQLSYYSGLLTDKDKVKEVRMLGLSDLFIERYKEVFKGYFAGLKKLFVNEGIWNIVLTIVTSTVNCALYLYIASLVCSGEIQVGDYSLYTGALSSIASGVASLIATTASIYEGTLFIDNMIAFMAEKQTIVPLLEQPRTLERHIGHTIKLENVSFRYPGTERDVIKNVNLTLDAGDTVVLVGLNGAGKTTLIKLITRLYDPTEGRILLDGHDIREYATEDIYNMFGIIFQDFGKYAVSASENISFGQLDKQVTEENIRTAAEQSAAADFIEKLPDGYNTPLMRIFESNGIELSGGQWQKLAVARAFYSDSDILILDEPTASLDAIAEQEIFNQFDQLRRDKTTIFVSHRLSSATVASKIVVLREGEVIEQGNHAQLMAAKGEYYRLFSTQAQRYISDASETINIGDNSGDEPTQGSFPPEGFPPRGNFPPRNGERPPEGFPMKGDSRPKKGFSPRGNFPPKNGERPESDKVRR